jgi:hypothetical protein
MKAASWADARKNDTVSLFDLPHLSPRVIYALASGKTMKSSSSWSFPPPPRR